MVTAMVLGIGVAGLVTLYTTADRGLVVSKEQSAALELARQRLERLTTTSPADLPQCSGQVGCRKDLRNLWPDRGVAGTYPCTQWIDGMSAADPRTGTTGRFRVDTTLTAPTAPGQQSGAQIISVSVCWQGADTQIKEITLERLLVPEV
jgi:hypothetical protein